MATPVKTWRYHLPSIKGEGWAVVHMDSLGFFAACSDWGNYAYIWGAHGMSDFRLFILNMERDWHYFGNKLAHDKMHWFNQQKTVEYVRAKILDKRKFCHLDKDLARENWDYLDELDCGDISFDEWVREQTLYQDWSAAAELAVREPDGDIKGFCTKVLPRLVKLIRAELEAETTAGIVNAVGMTQTPL